MADMSDQESPAGAEEAPDVDADAEADGDKSKCNTCEQTFGEQDRELCQQCFL